jgi:hypothetical protein
MKQERPGEAGTPLPEYLAGYVDGELDPATRQQVEAWLTRHPEAAADLETQRRLVALWQATSPQEPAPAQWEAVLDRIKSALPRPKWRPFRRAAFAVGGLAAAVLLAILYPRPQIPEEPDPPEEVPFAVVSPEDVEIVRMHPADRMGLVIGEPPLEEGEVRWVSAGDITVEKMAPDADGMVPLVALSDGPVAAMIMAPADSGVEPAP